MECLGGNDVTRNAARHTARKRCGAVSRAVLRTIEDIGECDETVEN